jgi:hypothetical protein|tara:strand:- start:611 stop:1213 length:603 start_codon:yes stop_codon:yes gene_type:complete
MKGVPRFFIWQYYIMKFELLIFGMTAFFVANTYHDGKYVQIMKSWKKYYQMAGIAFVGLSFYLFMKKYPSHTRSLFKHANGVIRYMPIDKDAGDLLKPLFAMSKSAMFTDYNGGGSELSPQQKRMLNSGKKGTKRCVSETKKKYVAAEQGWKCGDCKKQLPAWYEVDHKVRLEYGGSNHIDNLVALCRDCHGKKTANENL